MYVASSQNPYEMRGLDPEAAAKLGAGFANNLFSFDYRSRGVTRSRKFRTRDKRFFIKPENVEKQLWLLDLIEDLPCRPVEPLVITEGEFDAIAAFQAGSITVSVPNGGNGHRTQGGLLVRDDKAFSYLWGPDDQLIPEVTQFQKIILATDGDEAGTILRDELAIRIGEGRCWYVEYPEKCKDLNDVMIRHGAEAVRSMLANAKPMRPSYLIKPSEIPPRRFEQLYAPGWKCLEPHMMLMRPELVVVTGIPGHGKGIFTRALCYHLAEQHGLRTAFCTPEDPAHRLRRDMKRFGMRHTKYPTPVEQRKSEEWADEHFRILSLPEDKEMTIPVLKQEMEHAVFRHNCQAFVMDPWNEVRHSMGNLTETKYIEDTLLDLKSQTRKLGLILFLVAHTTKLKEGESATLYSINGSANWYNKADHGIIVARGEDPNGKLSDTSKITLQKCKDHETMGKPGNVMMRYDRDTADYVELPKAVGGS